MAKFLAVVNGATLECSLGQGKSLLRSTTAPAVIVQNQRLATIKDHKLGRNIFPFASCDERPDHKCVPILPSPWKANLDSGVSVGVAGILPASGKLRCEVGGDITVCDTCQSTVVVGDFRKLAELIEARAAVLEAYQKLAGGGDYTSPFDALSFALENMAQGLAGGPPPAKALGGILSGLSKGGDVLGWVDGVEEEHMRQVLLDRLKEMDSELVERIERERGWSEQPQLRAGDPPPERPQARSVVPLVPRKKAPEQPKEPMPRGGVPPGAIPLDDEGKPKKP